MNRSQITVVGWVVLVVFLVLTMWSGSRVPGLGGPPPRADADAGTKLDDETRGRTLQFTPGVTPDVQGWFQTALARMNPQARRLVDAVDGQVTVHVHTPEMGAAGFVQPHSQGFILSVDGPSLSRYGPEIRDHVIAHELGHVVDIALVPAALNARLDAGVPRIGGCNGEYEDAGCAPAEERFADTFAKWALNDPVVLSGVLSVGYRVAPPSSLAVWGEPLGTLPV